MNKNFTLFLFFIFTLLCSNAAYSQCPADDITLSTQAEVDDFPTNYPGCTTIPAGVEITVEGDDIVDLDGLLPLETIDGQLEIENCPMLTSIEGLKNITTITPEGELEIENCDALESLDGLEMLTSCHDLEIKDCGSLTDISALSNLETVSGELKIKNNDALTNLDGLENITSIGGGPDDDNQANGLFIYDNSSLTDCDGLCGLINMPGGISGDIDVHDNGAYPCNDFADWEIHCELLALPVELSSFKGYAMERTNLLNWQTESEENTMVFLVERSFDGRRDFTEVGRVNAVGNSTTLQNYEIEDADPISLAYYRLRIVDFDGTFEFSEVIAVQRTKTEIDLVEVYPNPAEEQVTVLVHAQAAGKAIMILSDFMGRKIKEERMELNPGVNRYTLDWDKHETNFYYLTIDNGNERIAKKILRASRD